VIPPGKVGKVTAQVHTESYRGPVEKEIIVKSDDPTNGVMALHVKANIVGSIQIFPRAYLVLPSPPNNDYDTKILVRKEKSEKGELNITDAVATVPWLAVKTRKVEKAEPAIGELPAAEPGDFIVELSVSDESAIVQSGQQVRFKTGLTREPQTAVPVSIAYQQAIIASPPTLVLMALDNAKETSGAFEVTVRSNLASQPVTTAVTPQAFSVKLEPDGPRRYKANVEWKWEGENPERLGFVTVTVAGESVRVPVRVRDKPFAKLPPGQQVPNPEAVISPAADGSSLPAPDTPAQKPQ
jgi:hypothetical protein